LGGSNEDEEVYWWIKPFGKVLSWSEIAGFKLAPMKFWVVLIAFTEPYFL